MPRLSALALLLIVPLTACTDDAGGDLDDEPGGLALLGNGSNDLQGVSLETVIDSDLYDPRDVEFNPNEPWQLWVANADDDSITVVDGLENGAPNTDVRSGSNARHFLANPTAIAFSDNGNLATAHDEDQATQSSTPDDFMGPTLWPADDDFDGGHSSHMDMLHNSPNGVGIASGGGNDFWYYDGAHQAISFYRFNDDHGMGGADHSDGEVYRYIEGELGYEEDVASHVALDADTGILYIADTANNRIVALDTLSGEEGNRMQPNYDGGTQRQWDNADWWVLVDGAEIGMEAPSGLELQDGMLWVSDFGNSQITAFDLDGNVIDWLDTGIEYGSIMGLAFAPDGSLFIADAYAETVLRLSVD